MKKKTLVFLSVLFLLVVSFIGVKALNPEHPLDAVDLNTIGEYTHGHVNLSSHETSLEEATSGYIARIDLSADPGYYVKNVTATFEGNAVDLGFETGQGFFRRTPFNPYTDIYEVILPETASDTNQVVIEVEFAKKTPITISYLNYEKNTYSDNDLKNVENYGAEHLLVEGYRDGDIVLPDDCFDNGCALKLQFDSKENYDVYKSVIKGDESVDEFISAAARIEKENPDVSGEMMRIETLATGAEACNNDEYYCYVIVRKEFEDLSYGTVAVGYNEFGVFGKEFVGFDIGVDVENFFDILTETGGSSIAFTKDQTERTITIFYGTKKLFLNKKEPRELICDGESNIGTLIDYDNVTGSGYGYNITYTPEVKQAVVDINTYYQNYMTLEMSLTKDGTNVLGKKIYLNLDRFAFAGNAMQLLESDVEGRNCRERDNHNTCDEGIYYSTQYRGVLSSFYVEPDDEGNLVMGEHSFVSEKTDDTITIANSYAPEIIHPRNQDFNPHALALFYDENDMVVQTKVFDLNELVPAAGYVTKDRFLELYEGFTIIGDLGNYVHFTEERTSLSNVDYFDNHLNETIMYDLVLIGKDEAEEQGIVKIALFLVNGMPEEGDTPSLTYGIGEGITFRIERGEE